jgi:hypothetical protein
MNKGKPAKELEAVAYETRNDIEREKKIKEVTNNPINFLRIASLSV